jgi:hypothetical protein
VYNKWRKRAVKNKYLNINLTNNSFTIYYKNLLNINTNIKTAIKNQDGKLSLPLIKQIDFASTCFYRYQRIKLRPTHAKNLQRLG